MSPYFDAYDPGFLRFRVAFWLQVKFRTKFSLFLQVAQVSQTIFAQTHSVKTSHQRSCSLHKLICVLPDTIIPQFCSLPTSASVRNMSAGLTIFCFKHRPFLLQTPHRKLFSEHCFISIELIFRMYMEFFCQFH